jgi:hypothetical protein
MLIDNLLNYEKIPTIVNILIDNNSLYQENLDRQKMIELMNQTFEPTSVPDVNSVSEQE